MPKHVWVAEDDLDLRRLIALVLRKDGHEVRELQDGKELWNALSSVLGSQEQPQLIVSDYSMPHLSGVDVLRRLREAGEQVPFILITAFPTEEMEGVAAEHGVRVFRKPFDLKLIREAVHLTA